MTRKETLERAAECVCTQREQDYGAPENNFAFIAELWESYIKRQCASPSADICVTPMDVAIMMTLLKIARIGTGTQTEDSFVDLAGYAACAAELAGKEQDR